MGGRRLDSLADCRRDIIGKSKMGARDMVVDDDDDDDDGFIHCLSLFISLTLKRT